MGKLLSALYAPTEQTAADALPWAWVAAGLGAHRWSILAGPGEVASAVGVHQQDAVAQRVRSLRRRHGRADAEALLADLQADVAAGWVVAGWLGYEVGAALEGLPLGGEERNVPDAMWWLCAPQAVHPVALRPLFAGAAPVATPPGLARQSRRYQAQVDTIVGRIADGEVYQVNLTAATSLRHPVAVDARAAVTALMAAQPVPMAIAIGGADHQGRRGELVAAGSMEQFLRVAGDTVTTRPIKGTAPRGRSPALDGMARDALAASAKERAENTMIVDMARNDLQRACLSGSVHVEVLCQPAPYATLWHLESQVRGQLRSASVADLLRATLPPASVTGCPKVQAMHVVAQLERRRRGPYCGTLFVAHPKHGIDFAVAIRTLVFARGRVQISAGAGIVADSQPDQEWRETCLKAQSGLQALQLLRVQGHGD